MEPLTVSGTLDSLSEIATYVMEAAKAAGLDKKTSYKLRLAVDEIATNIIVHGYEEAGREGLVVCQAILADESLTITLEDTGEQYDPTKQALPNDMDLPMEQRQIGGLGVYLTIQGVDKFIYERIGERNRNIFVVNRNHPATSGTVHSSTSK
ncbi:MAG: ATP-binding protein [Mojavia pulchra JT2-VF2]|jgi:anti-sigma regulatory factor (Ser/Thr protein kinase)|uniref:ATP-binding protein n=1 Tax=Mojavia pulchra JT2-VF2 TaxID=287848 RepID=A0A951UG46_9NOST|nr:ATP-binding protein [Mojavia pulchra JT2-VF2]